MNLNTIIFPAPEPSYISRFSKNIIWIPRNYEQRGEVNTLNLDPMTKQLKRRKTSYSIFSRVSFTTDQPFKKQEVLEGNSAYLILILKNLLLA